MSPFHRVVRALRKRKERAEAERRQLAREAAAAELREKWRAAIKNDGPCPQCGMNWRGAPIPKKWLEQGLYAPGVTHYSRLIALSCRERDRVVGHKCPNCGAVSGEDPR